MATVGLAIANLQETPVGSSAQQAPNSAFPANATVTQAPIQQGDTVTLTTRTADSQQAGTNNGNPQFGQAGAFFFAESQTFRAANGSGGNQAPQAATAPQLPVKTTEATDAAQNSASNSMQPQALSAASTNPPPNLPVAAGATNSAATATNSPPGAANTPSAELAQLDDTLQEIGINPESISLFNRMAMLLYANDPAALRVLVQTLQTGAQQLTTAAQQTVPAVTANPDQPAAGSGTDEPVLSLSSVAANSATTSLSPSNEFEELNFSLAVRAYPGSASNQQQQPGQLLNVTA